MTGAIADGTSIVGYIHEGDSFFPYSQMFAHNPEFGQPNKPYSEYNAFVLTQSKDIFWRAEPILLSGLDLTILNRKVLYIRTIDNFTEDLGNGVKRFWLSE